MTFFSERISIFMPKISDDLFLVIDQVFRIVPFFSQIFCIFTMLNVVYDPFLTRKTTISEKNSFMTPFFYSVRTFTRIPQHYFSKYWGDGCMDRRPTPQILGGTSPQSALGLRPCYTLLSSDHGGMDNSSFESIYFQIAISRMVMPY